MAAPAPDECDGSTRLYLDDLPTPVVARVARRTPEALTLGQDLPFLRLRSGVRDADGRHAELASVYLAVHGDTPRLMLELRYTSALTDAAPDPCQARRDHAPTYAPLGESRAPARRDATVPYVLEGALRSSEHPVGESCPPSPDPVDEEVTQLFRTVDVERETVFDTRPRSELARPHAPLVSFVRALLAGLTRWLGRAIV